MTATFYVIDPIRAKFSGLFQVRAYDRRGGTVLGLAEFDTIEQCRVWRWTA
jgi:hypothetical protein